MATQKKTTTKKRAAKKTSSKATAAKPKAGELCTFAIRITPAERDAIHKAAGPRRATRFVRELAIAAAHGDSKGIQRVLKEARGARS